MKRPLGALFVAVPTVPPALAQDLQTTAGKDDWEEINFEFNSSVLSDGYPSLLRMAEDDIENSVSSIRGPIPLGGPVIETIARQLRLPSPTVQLGQLYGDYPFEVTVTNTKGASAKALVTVRLAVTRVL